jgi:hypothetical protein
MDRSGAWPFLAPERMFSGTLLSLELFQFRCQRVARAAVRAGENEQHTPSAKFLQRKFTTSIQQRKQN